MGNMKTVLAFLLGFLSSHVVLDPIQFSNSDSAKAVLNGVAEYGIDRTNLLYDVTEPMLYKKGVFLQEGNPAKYLAAINRQKPGAKKLARFGYATVHASSLLTKQFLLSRQQVIFALGQISLKNTPLYDSCPTKSEDVEPEKLCPALSAVFRTFDGSCNNVIKPRWGAAMTPLIRFIPPHYQDDISEFRMSVTGSELPSPRGIRTMVHRDINITSSRTSLFLMQFGQFLDHDITFTPQVRGFNGSIPRCCTEDGQFVEPELMHPDCAPITIPQDDAFFGPMNRRCMEFLRSSPTPREDCTLGPRDQLNQITGYIDASNVYGSTEEEAEELRLHSGGELKYSPLRYRKPLLPALKHFTRGEECRPNSPNLHCFHAGDERVNEQPGLATLHTLFLREHNRIVMELSRMNPHWNDNRLYHEGRKIVGAIMQNIVYSEFLPVVLGKDMMEVFHLRLLRSGFYRGYNDTVNPSIANVFATAAFRFGHSLVDRQIERCDKHHRVVPIFVDLHNELMNPANLHNFGSVDRIVLGLSSQRAQKRDEYITQELTNHLFQPPRLNFGLDLGALNIQRGRDHGLPPYNEWRQQCGLQRFQNWGQLLQVMSDDTVGRLKISYSHVDDIDLFVGGISEKPVRGGVVGPTFACILGQQFLNVRRGDRFWFENGNLPSSFTTSQLRQLRRSSLSRIICDNLDDIDTIQPFVLMLPNNDTNPHVSCLGAGIQRVSLQPWIDTSVNRPTFLDASDALNDIFEESDLFTTEPESFDGVLPTPHDSVTVTSSLDVDEDKTTSPTSDFVGEMPTPFMNVDNDVDWDVPL